MSLTSRFATQAAAARTNAALLREVQTTVEMIHSYRKGNMTKKSLQAWLAGCVKQACL